MNITIDRRKESKAGIGEDENSSLAGYSKNKKKVFCKLACYRRFNFFVFVCKSFCCVRTITPSDRNFCFLTMGPEFKVGLYCLPLCDLVQDTKPLSSSWKNNADV